MKICVVGTGYVGLVAGTCLADLGHDVICVDNDLEKIALLNSGGVPIYEPGLDHLIHRNVKEGRLSFTDDGVGSVKSCSVVYIAVGTPPAADGSADLSGVKAVAKMIGASIEVETTVVIKSTVPVGTSDMVRKVMSAETDVVFDIASNPEFLKEGAAIDDFMKPDRIVVGFENPNTKKVMDKIYGPLMRTSKPIIYMDNRSAELTKYTANAFLATRISFINEISQLCERVGADIDSVRKGAGSDSRIGLRFFFPGVGYGGSCFPKDVKALITTAEQAGMPLTILDAVEAVNASQKRLFVEKIRKRFGSDLSGMKFAIWGLSFKPETDDMREAPSLVIIEGLLSMGAEVAVYDPEAMTEASHVLGDSVIWAENSIGALDGADALVLVTEWHEFKNPKWTEVTASMRQKIVFDGRNIYDPESMRSMGYEIHSIGRP